MNATNIDNSQDLPPISFSIVLETENLALEGPAALDRCLGSLCKQRLDFWTANEVIVTDSGDIDEDVKASLKAEYPNLLIRDLPKDTGYYEAKMLGAELASGEVVVFCDSDIEYLEGWLSAMLQPFSDSPEVEFLCGETSYAVSGPYSLALLLTFYFPPFSGKSKIRPCRGYAANNFAIRRNLLARLPIPTGLGLYRGNCQIHAEKMRQAGVTIWRQPKARGIHPVLRPTLFLQRFFLAGHHAWKAYLHYMRLNSARDPQTIKYLCKAIELCGRQVILPILRLPAALKRHPSRLMMLPLALPIILATIIVYFMGLFLTMARPSFDFSAWAFRLEEAAR